jgi:4-hydroxy-tetrahydrodipicolinate synthase
MTGCRASPELIARLASEGIVVGMKDSGGDAAFLARVATATAGTNFRLFVGGSANLLGALALGVDGVTGGLGNFATHLDRAVIDAFRVGDMARARAGQSAIGRVNAATFFALPRNAASITKAVLAALGICGEATFPPVAPLTAAESDVVRRNFAALGLKVPA